MDLTSHGIDPATVTGMRPGNAIWPALSLFTGVSFLIHGFVLAFGGLGLTSPTVLFELAASAVFTAIGGIAMAKRRYFFVTVETTQGRRHIGRLTKAEQQALLAAHGGGSA